MNIYFLLEGRITEKKVYKSWLQYMYAARTSESQPLR